MIIFYPTIVYPCLLLNSYFYLDNNLYPDQPITWNSKFQEGSTNKLITNSNIFDIKDLDYTNF